ncbi:MAG: haloacid dehalogenase type II [Cellulomonas sp.]
MTTTTRIDPATTGTDAVALPTVIVFDVNETLSNMSPMADRFVDVGAPAHLAATWFATLLRDGFALTAAGSMAPFAQLGTGVLRASLQGRPLNRTVDDAITHIMGGFAELDVHPDIRDGLPALSALGTRLVTLSNGARVVAEQLFARAGVSDQFERLLSVEDAGVWKPAPGAYAYAAAQCGTAPAEMMLVAVHPWDIDGADRAGLRTVWINRTGAKYPDYFRAPTLEATSLGHLAQLLAR